MLEGFGMISPLAMASSIHRAMASLAFSMASSIPLSAAEKQPGRSGATTPQAVVSLPGSIAIGYFMVSSLFHSSLTQQLVNQSDSKIFLGVRDTDMPRLGWVSIDVVGTFHAS